jgi:uncharacterized membrane protein
MSDAYTWIKVIHVLSSTILFGTGLGTAFHMWMAHLRGDPRTIASVSRNVVLADFLFTTPSAIVQPVSGIALVRLLGVDPLAPWLLITYALFALAGLCWLLVVWLQIRVRDMVSGAVAAGLPLPAAYQRAMTLWFALGWPAFIAVTAIFWLMVTKPELW